MYNNNNNNNNNFNLENIFLTNVFLITLKKNGYIKDSNIKLNNQAAVYIYQYTKDKSKIYVGSTFNLVQRFEQHKYRISKKSKSCPIFYNYVLKHGWSKFSFGILEYLDLSKIINTKQKRKILLNKEQYYLNTLNPSLNVNRVAGSMLGYKHTKTNIEVIRISSLSRNHTEETKLKMAISNIQAQAVIVINNITGEISNFISIRKASKFIGKHHSYIAKCLKRYKFYKNKEFTISIK